MATALVDIPPSNYGVPGSHMLHNARLPEIPLKPSEAIDPSRIANQWAEDFNLLVDGQGSSAKELFLTESYWRDLSCSSWNFHTFQGLSKISIALEVQRKKSRSIRLQIDSPSDYRKPSKAPVDFKGQIEGVQAFLIVETDIGRGRGLVKLVQDGETWKAFTLFTTLEELKGHEEAVCSRRPSGVDHGAHPGRLNWQERRNAEANCEGHFEPTVLIIGMHVRADTGELHLTYTRFRPGRSHCSCSTEAVGGTDSDHRSKPTGR